MKAMRFHAYGEPKVLVYEDVPRPQPQPGQVLIRVEAAGINPLDWKIRSGYMKSMMNFPLPLILGLDVSGTVVETSPNSKFKTGQEVFGVADISTAGAYAEFALANETALALKPQTLTHVQAASVPVVASTAWQALFEIGQLSPKQTILVHAAAGGVGMYAVQLAKYKGANVVGTASAHNLDFVSSLGAKAIDYRNTAFEKEVSDVDLVLDTIGGDTQAKSWSVLKPDGILISTLSPPDAEIAEEKGVRAAMVRLQPQNYVLTEIASLLDSGKLKTYVDRILPLADADLAHELSQNGHVRGKLVLQMRDTSIATQV